MKDCKALGTVLAHEKCPQILNSPPSHNARALLISLKNHKKFKKMLTDLHPFHTNWLWENISPFCVFSSVILHRSIFLPLPYILFSPGLPQNGVCGHHYGRYMLSLSSVFYHISIPTQPVMMETLHICPSMEWQYLGWTLRQTMDSGCGMLIMGEVMQVWRQRMYENLCTFILVSALKRVFEK